MPLKAQVMGTFRIPGRAVDLERGHERLEDRPRPIGRAVRLGSGVVQLEPFPVREDLDVHVAPSLLFAPAGKREHAGGPSGESLALEHLDGGLARVTLARMAA